MTSGANASSSAAYLRASSSPSGPTVLDLDVLPDGPTQLLQGLQKRGVAVLRLRIVHAIGHERSYAPRRLVLLRARRERPRSCRTNDCSDEIAAPHCLCVATILRTECPLWVKSGHYGVSERCPLYSQKRTLIEHVGMSALCQKQTFASFIRSPRRQLRATMAGSRYRARLPS